MSHHAQLWIFFLIVLGVVALPGLDMAFVTGSSLLGGRRRGLAAVAGIVVGGICHTTAGATGASVLLSKSGAAFNAMLLAGAGWIAWIGVGLLRRPPSHALEVVPPRTLAATFRQAVFTCLLNPKAYVFMLAVFPQFLTPQEGTIAVQAVLLGAIIAGTQIAVYGSVAFAAAGMGTWLAKRPNLQMAVSRCVGVVLLSCAGLSAAQALAHGRWTH
jgi:threonine/homoserine/homoserine lactone efflux protein